MLLDIALAQNIRELNADIDAGVDEKSSTTKMTYSSLGMPVCRSAFAALMGVSWSPRLSALLSAVLAGRHAPPMDLRYMSVYSYLQSLYESVAETLPLDDKSIRERAVMFGVRMLMVTRFVVPLKGLKNFDTFHLVQLMTYVWRQFNSTSGQTCSWHTFHSFGNKNHVHAFGYFTRSGPHILNCHQLLQDLMAASSSPPVGDGCGRCDGCAL